MPNPYIARTTAPGAYAMPENSGNTSPARLASLDGVIMKTIMIFAVLLAGAALGWSGAVPIYFVMPLAFAALGIVWYSYGHQSVNAYTAFLYAGLEGTVIGIISALYEQSHPGIVNAAVISTLFTAGIMFTLWRLNIIKVDSLFRRRLYNFMVAYLLVSMGNLFYSWVSGNGGLFAGQYGWIASLVGCGLASFSLAADFQNIEEAIDQKMPEKAEWALSLGMIISIIWLYLEILRLLGRRK